jgi:hypothetical protein
MVEPLKSRIRATQNPSKGQGKGKAYSEKIVPINANKAVIKVRGHTFVLYGIKESQLTDWFDSIMEVLGVGT